MLTFEDMSGLVTEQEPLSRHTWFGLGGPARWFAKPNDRDQLCTLVRRARENDIPLRLLGLGANLLVSDEGVPGLVVRLHHPSFRQVHWPESTAKAEEITLRVGGGMDMYRLTLDTVRAGWAGLEVMAGIPGTLGGIIRMNAGGRYGEIADVVETVTVVDEAGELETLTHAQVGFMYRRTDLAGKIVCEATLRLRRDDSERLYRRYMEIWNYKKQSQPLADYSAGCIFKNPRNDSAGRLIDAAGLKGHTVGGASVSAKHANFIVVKEGGTARDVLDLIGTIRREVAQQFSVELELEVEVWGHRYSKTLEEASSPG